MPTRPHIIIAAVIATLVTTLSSALAQCPNGSPGTWSLSPYQTAAGPLGVVYAMTSFDPDGAGPEPVSLIAAGSFQIAGSAIVNNIAYWNGTQWRPLGAGFDSNVLALAVYNGELYAAGNFLFSGATPCSRIARWNGTTWVALATGLNAEVRSLAVYNSRLYAGGLFTTAGGVPANAVANWDGSVWRSLGTAVSGGGVARDPANSINYTPRVNAMGVFDGKLFIGGMFDRANNAVIGTLASWDGVIFSSVGAITHNGSFLPQPEVLSIAVYANSFQGSTTIYVGGDFNSIGGSTINYIASYTKSILTNGPWIQVGSTIGGPVQKVTFQSSLTAITGVVVTCTRRPFDTSSWVAGTYRYASGVWNQLSTDIASSLHIHAGTIHAGIRGCSAQINNNWLPLGPGLNGNPTTMTIDGPNLYLAGRFTVADQQVVGGITRLDAAGYHPVGIGLLNSTSAGLESVYDIAVHAGSVFAVGSYRITSTTTGYKTVRFDGTQWTDTFISTSENANYRLKVVDGTLYRTGVAVHRWNGLSWQIVGGTVPSNRSEDIFMWNGALHVTGQQGVYRLDGSTWTLAYAIRPQFLIATMAIVFQGRLFVNMTTQGIPSIDELVNGQFVESFGGVKANGFVEYGGSLYAILYNGLARLNGTQWQVVSNASGIDIGVFNNLLTIVGTDAIDSIATPIFAQLECCPADFNHSGTLTAQDIFDFLNSWFLNEPAADFNHSGSVSAQDIFDFLNAWFIGC